MQFSFWISVDVKSRVSFLKQIENCVTVIAPVKRSLQHFAHRAREAQKRAPFVFSRALFRLYSLAENCHID